ncbi:MAG: DMT family transporter [Acidimicrobiia bacterium]|nr:DMT family transporter [Acidimicrobiia bacterium]
MTQLLAISSAALFGIADFAGGIATRRMPAWKVTAWTQLLGIPMLVVGLVIVAAPEVTRSDLLWGAAGGLFGLVGLAIMYATLAAGAMSVVAPIIGAGAAIIPVIWAVVTGESMSPIEWAGIVAAGGAVALLASQPGVGRLNRRLFVQALAAALGFGVFFIALGQTNEASGLWPLAAARMVTIPVAFSMVLLLRMRPIAPHGSWRLVATAGFFDMTGNIAIVLAVQRGPLGINAVLGSLYPLFTVAAAIIILKERPTARQLVGIALAVGSILLLAI